MAKAFHAVVLLSSFCPTPQPKGSVHSSVKEVDGFRVTWTRLDGWKCRCSESHSVGDCSHVKHARTH